jgi:hypothetical protein
MRQTAVATRYRLARPDLLGGGRADRDQREDLDGRSGIASAKAAFVCQEPRPADGRVTVLAYAIGEESFVDLNGNNTYDPGEPFQDLGDIVKDMLFDNSYDPANDEYVSLQGVAAGSSACVSSFVSAYPKLATSANIPSRPNTCDGTWTSRTYVRRAVETVLSTSDAGLIWGARAGSPAAPATPSASSRVPRQFREDLLRGGVLATFGTAVPPPVRCPWSCRTPTPCGSTPWRLVPRCR